ncbi:MAG: thioredoxin family protein [Verrucomicrobiota bacterium]
MKKRVMGLALSLLFGWSAAASAGGPKLMVTKFHADYCGSCKKIGAFLPEIKSAFGKEAVLFTELDFTDANVTRQSNLLAGALGLDEAVAANKGTGFLLMTDASGKVLGKLTKHQDKAEMIGEIKKQLASAGEGTSCKTKCTKTKAPCDKEQ